MAAQASVAGSTGRVLSGGGRCGQLAAGPLADSALPSRLRPLLRVRGVESVEEDAEDDVPAASAAGAVGATAGGGSGCSGEIAPSLMEEQRHSMRRVRLCCQCVCFERASVCGSVCECRVRVHGGRGVHAAAAEGGCGRRLLLRSALLRLLLDCSKRQSPSESRTRGREGVEEQHKRTNDDTDRRSRARPLLPARRVQISNSSSHSARNNGVSTTLSNASLRSNRCPPSHRLCIVLPCR